jgi:hypothetical protein
LAPIVAGMPIVTILQGPRDAEVKRELLAGYRLQAD